VSLPLLPAGKVLLRGAIWDAVAPSNLNAGEQVVVRGVENLVLQVEPSSQPETMHPAQA
jgi:membrane-bound ClpP family serine protease